MTQTFKTQMTKNIPGKKLVVVREFAAPVELVWDAWTQAHLLDQWWAPKPWKAETKSMDFRPGGRWIYSMVGPDGTRIYASIDYHNITPREYFSGKDGFCDEEGNPNREMPSMEWHNTFQASAIGTKVEVTITFDTEDDLRKIVEMGFEEGFAMAHNNLDDLLAK